MAGGLLHRNIDCLCRFHFKVMLYINQDGYKVTDWHWTWFPKKMRSAQKASELLSAIFWLFWIYFPGSGEFKVHKSLMKTRSWVKRITVFSQRRKGGTQPVSCTRESTLGRALIVASEAGKALISACLPPEKPRARCSAVGRLRSWLHCKFSSWNSSLQSAM